MTRFEHWQVNLQKIQLPHWDELPDLDLYVDQVVALVNDRAIDLGIAPITKSMINNYVKKGIIMAPIKKKYSRYQLAAVILIALLKGSFSITSIHEGISQVTINNYPQQAYDRFVDLVNARLHNDPKPVATGIEPVNDQLIGYAVETLINRMSAAQLLKIMREEQQPRDVKKG